MQKNRLLSLDVLRGITILMMVIVNNPGNWDAVYPALLHAEWNGCKLADFVFPFFIFIMGMAIPLAMPNKEYNGTVASKILVRSLRIICLGLFLNFFTTITLFEWTGYTLLGFRLLLTLIVGYALMGNYNERLKLYVVLFLFTGFMTLAFGTIMYQEIRILGVLQRIGIVYFFASLCYLITTPRTQLLLIILLLMGYWGVMSCISIPDGIAPNLEKGTNIAAWIDELILGNHVYAGTKPWDPEGLLSTIPAIAQAMIGVLVGRLILKFSATQVIKILLFVGTLLIALGIIWSFFFPLNKSLWSSSYVLYTSGVATLLFCILYYLIDFKNHKTAFKPLLIWGVNPMIIFFLSGIIPRALAMIKIMAPEELITVQNYWYRFVLKPLFENPMNASLAHTLVFISFFHVILLFLYTKKWIIKV